MRTLCLCPLVLGVLFFTPSSSLADPLTLSACVGNRASDSISIIDVANDTVAFTIHVNCCQPGGICSNPPPICIDGPHDIAFNADGSRAFVTAYYADKVVVIDTTPLLEYPPEAPEIIGHAFVGERPQGIVVKGDFAYVACSGTDEVYVLDITSTPNPAFEASVSVMNDPNGIDITPDGSAVYVTNNGSGTVSVIETDTYTVTDTIYDVDAAPRRIVIGDIPGVGVRAYTVNATGDNVSVIDASDASFETEIALDGDGPGGNSRPRGIALHPDLERLYVTEYVSAQINIIDTSDNTITTTFDHNDSDSINPYRIAITPDGTKAYIANQEVHPGLISVLNLTNNSFDSPVEVQSEPGGISILNLE